jgi:hypothetical protein
MNTGKNRVKGLKTELFKKKYQTAPVVSNPTDELQSQGILNVVSNATQDFERKRAQDAAYRQQIPLRSPYNRQYTPEEIAKMKRNFPMSAEDFQIADSYGISGIPDLTEGQDVNDTRGFNQLQTQGELATSTPASLRNFQNPDFNQRVQEASEQSTDSVKTKKKNNRFRDAFEEGNWRDYVRTGTGVFSAAAGLYEDVENREKMAERIQNLNDRPRYMPNEYEYMARPGSQSVIYAKDGAQIRTGTQSGAEEAELERGEMFMLPNLDTYQVGGKRHSQGGEDFVLPEGTIVFSDHLKVPGVGKTFAEQAKKFDITKYKEILENPHSKSVDRTTAEIMMDRNMKKLQELFQIQQSMNGDSNGELKEKTTRQAQVGMYNRNMSSPVVNTEDEFAYDPTLGQMPQKSSSINAGSIGNYINSDTSDKGLLNEINNIVQTKQAASNTPYKGNITGANPQPVVGTATNLVQGETSIPGAVGDVSKTNAADKNSIYRKKLANGRSVYIENQGEFAGKNLRDQYGGDIWNLVRNRLDENYDALNPLLLSAYQMQLKNKNLTVGSGEQLVDIMESGNGTLVAMRNFFKGVNLEEELFDPALDKGADNNMKQKKTAELFKKYVESPQFIADVKAGKITTTIPWLKSQPKEIKNAKGEVTGYKLDSTEIDQDFTEQYQAAYKAFGGVKAAQKKLGKDKDMLRGYRIDPEGLSDHMWMNLPISPVDRWGGNTTIGQISAFEDEEPERTKPKPQEVPKKTGDPGKVYDTKLRPAPTGEYIKDDFDYPQLAPEIYGLASAQIFPYAPMDYNAPYLMPQTLNIQPQLQDVDSSYMAALNSGADPNSALIATLGAKQKLFSEKQNFDAQQRASADQYNAQARWQEDIQDMQSLDKVYNSLIAQADDAVTAQKQALVASATQKRSIYNMEENKKKLYMDNFVRNYKVDGRTGAIVINNPEGYDPLQLQESYNQAYLTEKAKRAAQIKLDEEEAAKKDKKTKTESTVSTTTTKK